MDVPVLGRRPAGAVAPAATGVGILAVGGLVLGITWMVFRAGLLRHAAARWEREWQAVEPPWSGRRG